MSDEETICALLVLAAHLAKMEPMLYAAEGRASYWQRECEKAEAKVRTCRCSA